MEYKQSQGKFVGILLGEYVSHKIILVGRTVLDPEQVS